MSPSDKYPKFKDKRTERFALGERVKEFHAFTDQAYKRLDILEAATNKESLMKLPSNHFESLEGDRKGQYSIRINKQWRIVSIGQMKNLNLSTLKLQTIILKGEQHGTATHTFWKNSC